MKACVFTLGCKLNGAESESIMRGLAELGYETTDELCPADLYLINTCAVTAEAEKKSRQAVARVRKFNPAARIVVFGCAAARDPDAFFRRSGVELVTGAMKKDRVLELLFERGVYTETENAFCELPLPLRTGTRAHLRVQDGCDRFCSYCIIPHLRGRSRSRSAESALNEARRLGAREIVLTGVDLSSYRDGERGLGELLLLLKDVPARIRLGSLEAGLLTEEFLTQMKAAGNVVPHFHLSLQSGSTRVLRAMNRRYTREEFLAACRRVYAAFPDAAITTDVIVGFPAEREEDFSETLSIVKEAGFARVHVFPFSPREGTPAAKLPDLPAAVKKERVARLLKAAKEQELAYLTRFLGTRRVALFETDGGYTDNYIRVYAEGAKEGGMYEVELKEIEKDGVRCTVVREV